MLSGKHPAEDADGNELYVQATVAEHARDYDTAFKLYLSAAQAHLHRARGLPSQRAADRAKCKSDAGICLERAERIKAARKDSLKPIDRDPFSKEEQTYVLDKSSNINDITFPIWSNSDTVLSGQSDASILPPLSSSLLSVSSVWKRPVEIYASEYLSLAGATLQPHQIRQNIVTDCSVCSAVAICLHHHRQFSSKLGLSCIFPKTAEGLPSISPNGIYAFRFFVNGGFRKKLSPTAIDDRLPFTTSGQPLSIMSSLGQSKVDIWAALLEKAYMKFMGGYDFPGSNSSIDVHALTGWIPEHLEINSSAFVREKVFKRVHEGFNQGSCVLSLGTGNLTNDSLLLVTALNGTRTKLLPTHSYAVTGVQDVAGDRWLTILNPWNGSAGTNSESSIVGEFEKLQIGNENRAGKEVIDVSWDEVCTVFDGLYLNWDPILFKYSTTFHGSWRTHAGSNAPQCTHYYLNLDLSSGPQDPKPNRRHEHELWILLSRHIVDKQHAGEFIAVHAIQLEQEEARREVGTASADLDVKGTYTSNTHSLIRLSVIGSTSRVAIVASYDGPHADVCFSVQAFCDSADLIWAVQPRRSAYERSIEGAFSSRNAGGNCTYSTFMNNPQYRLRLYPDSRGSVTNQSGVMERMRRSLVRLIVEGPRNIPLNVMLVWRTEAEAKERVLQVRPGDAVANSGPYSYGIAQAGGSVTPGEYCIIVSTFEPRLRGNFALRIESSLRMEVEDIPAEGAGMFCKTIKGAWQPGLDGGSPRYGRYDQNPMFGIEIRTATTLKLRLQLAKPSASIALNVTLYASPISHFTSSTPSASSSILSSPLRRTQIRLDRQVATSGAYVDGSSSPAGVVIPQMSISPGKYIAVVSTFDPGTHTAFQLLVFAKTDVRVSSISE
ncbi:cysteine proteinase [Fomitiporia mediterranea MF3/22]|uniref:cysteine proteinase n=1 Tax=Fomitiporia mediterranea (strain MF3/22) TaxID=694068 RepID=UPI0004407FFE|nr:cysteine proteinase [Fomitiporia mediterranea MF3/22]EJD08078.1 cysteine proteinase [Fomitiporia mediterranea MF3/22]